MAGLTEADLSLFFAALDDAARSPLLTSQLTQAVTVRFVISNLGVWTLRASSDGAGSVTADSAAAADGETSADADCTLSCEKSVLLDLANGRRKFIVAFMKGLISVRGDRSVFSALQPIIRAAAEDFRARREERLTSAGPSRALRVTVHGASVVADRSETFAVYLLEVFEGDSRWTLARRCSELRTLARRLYRLRHLAANGVPLPSLPRSLDLAGSLEASFLTRRTGLMSGYLSGALAALPTSVLHATGAEPIIDFLSPDGPSLGGSASAAPTSTQRPQSLTSPGLASPHSHPHALRASYSSLVAPAGAGPRASINGVASSLSSPPWTALAAPAYLSPRGPNGQHQLGPASYLPSPASPRARTALRTCMLTCTRPWPACRPTPHALIATSPEAANTRPEVLRMWRIAFPMDRARRRRIIIGTRAH